ncbi:MAG: hypothetical protein H8D63_00130 [Parcubacteria group bacterium]|nr:hypothetical protein [Parcubacteria group bacterium]
MIHIPVSCIGEEVGNLDTVSLLNTAVTPFILDGEVFPSLQVFVFAICFPDFCSEGELFFRDVVKKLHGKALLNFIVRSKTYKEGKVYWNGKVYDLYSREHYNLVSCAVYAKAEHASVQDALRTTVGRRLVFTDTPENPFNDFIARVFEQIRDSILVPVN